MFDYLNSETLPYVFCDFSLEHLKQSKLTVKHAKIARKPVVKHRRNQTRASSVHRRLISFRPYVVQEILIVPIVLNKHVDCSVYSIIGQLTAKHFYYLILIPQNDQPYK